MDAIWNPEQAVNFISRVLLPNILTAHACKLFVLQKIAQLANLFIHSLVRWARRKDNLFYAKVKIIWG